MSYWVKAKLEIRDLETFSTVCRSFNVSMEERNDGTGSYILVNQNTLEDKAYRNYATLSRTGDGDDAHYVLNVDNDTNYNSFTKGLGKDSCDLMKEYAYLVTTNNVYNNGGMVMERIDEEDGSILLKVAVGGY